MINKELAWILDAIDEAPTKEALTAIEMTAEWFYDHDKNIAQLEYLVKRINEAKKLKD
jgi:hypothetical protein